MKVLITGVAGFIGHHLSNKLLSDGHDIYGVDNLLTGSMSNVNKNINFIKKDIKDSLDINEKIDCIINLACPASPKHYQKNPIDTMLTSVVGTANLILLAKENNCRIIHASTSEVYGDPVFHPQKETYNGNVNPLGPRACYDEGKRAAETLLLDANRSGLDVCILRLFNVYGPGMSFDDGRVIPNLITQALKGEDLTIYGTGEQTRSLCYIDDVVNAFVRSMYYGTGDSKVINIGNPNEITINQLAFKISKLLNKKSTIKNLGLPVDDPSRRCPDISLARTVMRWEPAIGLDRGLQLTIDDFSKRLGLKCG